MDLTLDLNHFSFSNPNPMHLPTHQTPSPNHRKHLVLLCGLNFSCRATVWRLRTAT